MSYSQFGFVLVTGIEAEGNIVSVSFEGHGPKKILADADGFKALDE